MTLNASNMEVANTSLLVTSMAPASQDPYGQGTWVIETIMTPAICAVGILGNVMNLVILTRRRLLAATEGKLEETAYCGMVALASSDLCYCCVAILTELIDTRRWFFSPHDFELYFRYISTYLQNVFSYVSTWFTVVMTVGRYVAICHPFRARATVNPHTTKIAIVIVALVWSVLCLPELWVYSFVYVPGSNNTASQVYLGRGAIYKHTHLHIACSYIWHTAGFLVPIVIMVFCNIQLVRALRESRRLRLEHTGITSCNVATVRHEMSLTCTLVLIVLLFFILVSPSEVLHFWSFVVADYDVAQHTLVNAIINVLNTLNFATNFLLYLGVNVHFRRTLQHILCIRSSVGGAEESGIHTMSTRVYRFSSTHL